MQDTKINKSIGYNYAIAKSLYDSPNGKIIINEVDKLLDYLIELILAYNNNPTGSLEKLNLIKQIFFKKYTNEQGQIGEPLVRINNKLQPVASLDELINKFIPSLNLREKMMMIKNFASRENDCIMFSILLEFSAVKTDKVNLPILENKYNMLNINEVFKYIDNIEKILGFDILETNKCYRDINGNQPVKCVPGRTYPLYKLIQSDYLKNPSKSPITVCWLWHPLVYGVQYQDVLKLQSDNYVKKLVTSFETTNNPSQEEECMTSIYSKYPLFPPLSIREKAFMKSKGVNTNIGDGIYQKPPYRPPVCYSKAIEPNSFYLNLLERYNKYVVSNLSGHSMLYIIIAKLFKNINLDLILLANVLFMVPYNHSIHEVLQAAKLLGVNTRYSIRVVDLVAINNILAKNNLTMISIPSKSAYMQNAGKRKTEKRVKNKTRRNTKKNIYK